MLFIGVATRPNYAELCLFIGPLFYSLILMTFAYYALKAALLFSITLLKFFNSMLYITVYGYIAALHKKKYNLEMIVAGGYKSFATRKIHAVQLQVMVEPEEFNLALHAWIGVTCFPECLATELTLYHIYQHNYTIHRTRIETMHVWYSQTTRNTAAYTVTYTCHGMAIWQDLGCINFWLCITLSICFGKMAELITTKLCGT